MSRKEYIAAWRAKNKDKIAKYYANARQWYVENRERRRIQQNERRAANLEAYRERDRKRYVSSKAVASVTKWRKSHPETFKAIDHAYRARKRKSPGRFTAEQISNLNELQNGKCVACRLKMSPPCADHIIPLACGGTNDIYNIQLLCRSCNAKKGKKDPVQFMQQRGYLL